jgi:hypothetical protein
MYGSSEQALYVLDQAVEVRARADVTWRSAIRQAMASGIPIEQIATRANTTIENVLAIVNASLRVYDSPRRVPAVAADVSPVTQGHGG